MKNNDVQFYKFSDNSIFNDKFTWAYKIFPRSEIVEFICEECGYIKSMPSGAFDINVEGGSKYPDILGCGAYPFLIVSQTVVSDWEGDEIVSFSLFPVSVVKVESSVLMNIEPPNYFRVEIGGHINIDLEAIGVDIKDQCHVCKRIKPGRSITVSGFQIVPSSWDGSDTFRDHDLFPRVNFCTNRVIEIASKNKHSNFRFEPLSGPFDPSSRGIDY